jgi:hypothetical protein
VLAATNAWTSPKSVMAWLEVANAVQDGRIFIELINGPFLFELRGTPPEYKAWLDLTIAGGWLWKHRATPL